MAIEQPSNDRNGDAPHPRDGDSAAAILSGERTNEAGAGGGLMGEGAAGPDAGSAMGKAGAATPNSPIDARLPHDGGEGLADAEARTRSLGDGPSERDGG